jgi:hypothetical protein
MGLCRHRQEIQNGVGIISVEASDKRWGERSWGQLANPRRQPVYGVDGVEHAKNRRTLANFAQK